MIASRKVVRGRSKTKIKTSQDTKNVRRVKIPRHIRCSMDDNGIRMLEALFKVFDTSGDDLMSAAELGTCLRATGFNPTDYEIQDIFQQCGNDRSGELSFSDFVVLWHRYCEKSRVNNESFVRRAFEFLDWDNMQAVPVSYFRGMMTDIGEPLTSEEMSTLFQLIDVQQEGMFYIDDFLKLCTAETIADKMLKKMTIPEEHAVNIT